MKQCSIMFVKFELFAAFWLCLREGFGFQELSELTLFALI